MFLFSPYNHTSLLSLFYAEIEAPVDKRPLLPSDSFDIEDTADSNVYLVTLVVGAGPYILRIHRHRARPLYLRPVRVSADEGGGSCYEPPRLYQSQNCLDPSSPMSAIAGNRSLSSRATSKERGASPATGRSSKGTVADGQRPPRRRTMHDFRQVHIQKINKRRVVQGEGDHQQQTQNSSMGHWRDSQSSFGFGEDVDDEDNGHLSDGSVNSLAAATRPHPLVDGSVQEHYYEGLVVLTDSSDCGGKSSSERRRIREEQMRRGLSVSTSDSSFWNGESSTAASLSPQLRQQQQQRPQSIHQLMTDSGSSSATIRGTGSNSRFLMTPLSLMLGGGLDVNVASPKLATKDESG